MTRRGAKHLARLRVHLALLAGILAIAAVTAWLLLPASEENVTWAHTTGSHFSAVDVREETICAITLPDKRLQCWGLIHNSTLPIRNHSNYESLHMGGKFHCALRDSAPYVHCWDSFFGRAEQGPDNWQDVTNPIRLWDVSVEREHTCWIDRDDTTDTNDRKLKCKDTDGYYLQTGPWKIVPAAITDYKFSQVTTGEFHTCGLVYDRDRSSATQEDEGLVTCFGDPLSASSASPPASMRFKTIDGADAHTCGILKDSNHSRPGLQDEDEIYCWGLSHDKRLEAPRDIAFKEVSTGNFFSCGIVKDGKPSTTKPEGELEENEDEVRCWGNNTFGQSDPPPGRYKSISASHGLTNEFTEHVGRHHNGGSFACAITIDSDPKTTGNKDENNIFCWGDLTAVSWVWQNNRHGWLLVSPFTGDTEIGFETQTPTPMPTDSEARDVIDSVIPGINSTCILTAAGGVRCFGRDFYGEADPPDDVRLDTISMGYGHACGLSHYGLYGKRPKDDDDWYPPNTNVVCWGDDRWGQSSPPEGEFVSVAAGGAASCGVKKDKSVYCWGKNLNTGIPTTKDFKDVKIGYQRDRRLWCTGYDHRNEWCPRERENDDYHDHACALKDDGDVVCWGDSDQAGATDSGETVVPTATGGGAIKFKSIAAGHITSCGIIDDGDPNTAEKQKENEAICWGQSGRPQFTQWVHATTPTPVSRPNNPTPTLVPNSIERFPHSHVTPTPGVPKFKDGTLTTHALATCGILQGKYEFFGPAYPQPPVAVSVKRSANRPYCQGSLPAYGGEEALVPGKWPWINARTVQYFNTGDYASIATSGYATCAVTTGGEIECVGMNEFDNMKLPRIATVQAGSADDDGYTCGSVTYQGASPIKGGRHSVTGTDGKIYYVTVPPAALANGKIVGIHISPENINVGGFAKRDEADFKGTFSGNAYTVTYVGTDTSGDAVCSPSTVETLTTVRDIDICIPKTVNQGRYVDWRLYEVENDAPTDDWYQGFTDLGDRVCAEVTELPITLAAASEIILPPAPPPVIVDHDQTVDIVREDKIGDTDLDKNVFVRVPKDALPAGEYYIDIKLVDDPMNRRLTTLDSVYKVGDLYVEINLYRVTPLDQEDEDVGKGVDGNGLVPPAQVCIAAPDGIDKAVYHLDDGATEWNKLDDLDKSSLTGEYAVYGEDNFACGVTSSLSMFVPTSLQATPTPIGGQLITRIVPNVGTITLPAKDRVRLSVNIYGVQDVIDNSLAEDVTFEWTVEPSGGTLREAVSTADDDTSVDEREALFITPSQAGRYTVKAWLDRYECRDDDNDDGCTAEFQINVRRAAATPVPTVAPVNPAGEIPIFITDADGNIYTVFTPEEGGHFEGDNITVSADPGAVPNGEIIGVRADPQGPASNVGQTEDRVTLDGLYYSISAVDASGYPLNGYRLDDPAEVCIPVPSRLKTDISEVTMVSVREDGTLANLSSSIRLGTSGVKICAALSTLSARVSAAHTGSPSTLPSPTPLPTPIDPDTGGTTPPLTTSGLILLILLGSALGILSLTLMRNFRNTV